MTTYLVIITTALVVTQLIRLAQNAVELHRQNILLKKQLGQLDDITNEDINRQREVYQMLHEYLSEKMKGNASPKTDDKFIQIRKNPLTNLRQFYDDAFLEKIPLVSDTQLDVFFADTDMEEEE